MNYLGKNFFFRAFASVCLYVGKKDAQSICRAWFHQPRVPDKLMKK